MMWQKKAKQYSLSIEFLGKKQQHVTKETARGPLEKNSYRINEKETQSNTVGYDQPGDMSYKAEQSGSITMVYHQPDIQKIGEKNCQPKNSEITATHGMNEKEMSSSAEESMGILHILQLKRCYIFCYVTKTKLCKSHFCFNHHSFRTVVSLVWRRISNLILDMHQY